MSALAWSLRHFKSMDEANAAVHCAPVKYSPITFAVAVSVRETEDLSIVPTFDDDVLLMAEEVLSHEGAYELDAGR